MVRFCVQYIHGQTVLNVNSKLIFARVMEQLFRYGAEREFRTAGNICSQLLTQQQLETFDDVQA